MSTVTTGTTTTTCVSTTSTQKSGDGHENVDNNVQNFVNNQINNNLHQHTTIYCNNSGDNSRVGEIVLQENTNSNNMQNSLLNCLHANRVKPGSSSTAASSSTCSGVNHNVNTDSSTSNNDCGDLSSKVELGGQTHRSKRPAVDEYF